MNANEIERALGSDPGIAPSLDFGARVMSAVRGEVRGREGIAFPWRRLRYGLGAAAVVTAAGVFARPSDLPATLAASTLFAATLRLGASLAVAWGAVWWSYRLAER